MTARCVVHRLRSERGQALVEFVIVLPLMFALIFLIAYAGVAFNRYLNVTDAAGVGARAAAVARFNPDPVLSDPCAAATQAANTAMGGLTVVVSCSPPGGQPGDPFSVTVTYTLQSLPFQFFDFIPLADIDVTSTVTERLE